MNIHQSSSAIPCAYHEKKRFFSRKIIIKREQNVVKSGLNIKRNVKMRLVIKVILRNPKRQFIWRMLKNVKTLRNS